MQMGRRQDGGDGKSASVPDPAATGGRRLWLRRPAAAGVTA
jgi:hypothetical protein